MILMKSRLYEEIELIPEDRLAELYNFVHFFRLGLEKAQDSSVSQANIDAKNAAEDNATEREREAFIRLHPTLVQQYPGEHVAIYGGELVDHDKDALKLSLRISKAYPNEFVWLAPLKDQAIEEWVFRSPRFETVAE